MDTSAATDAEYEENTSNLSTSKQNTDPNPANPTQKSKSESDSCFGKPTCPEGGPRSSPQRANSSTRFSI